MRKHAPLTSHTRRLLTYLRIGSIFLLVLAALYACATDTYRAPREIETRPPKVSYKYSSDEGLVEANAKARTYCSQYAATPNIQGTVKETGDGQKAVTFECVRTAAVVPTPSSPTVVVPPPATSRGFSYRSDTELLRALDSASIECSRNGLMASSTVYTNPDGSKTLAYQCIPR